MKIDDVRALWAVRRHAADDAAQQAAQADAERAAAEQALATFRAHLGDEVQRAQGLALSLSLARWYGAAAAHLHALQSVAVARAGQAAQARESLRAAMTEAERIGTLTEQLETQRRARISRHAQERADELGLRRRLPRPR
jgi:hypothetical protein